MGASQTAEADRSWRHTGSPAGGGGGGGGASTKNQTVTTVSSVSHVYSQPGHQPRTKQSPQCLQSAMCIPNPVINQEPNSHHSVLSQPFIFPTRSSTKNQTVTTVSSVSHVYSQPGHQPRTKQSPQCSQSAIYIPNPVINQEPNSHHSVFSQPCVFPTRSSTKNQTVTTVFSVSHLYSQPGHQPRTNSHHSVFSQPCVFPTRSSTKNQTVTTVSSVSHLYSQPGHQPRTKQSPQCLQSAMCIPNPVINQEPNSHHSVLSQPCVFPTAHHFTLMPLFSWTRR